MRTIRALPIAGIVIAVLLATASCSSSPSTRQAAIADATASTSGPTTTTSPPGRTLHWTNEGPPLTLLAPYCVGGTCVYPFTQTGSFHGDLEGTHVSAGVSALDPTGKRYAISRTDVFTGTVKGCGTGTMVLLGTEDATATGGTGAGKIVYGFGTGGLQGVRGDGVGKGNAGPDGIRSEFTGHVTC